MTDPREEDRERTPPQDGGHAAGRHDATGGARPDDDAHGAGDAGGAVHESARERERRHEAELIGE